ncbi:nitrous oxide reductase family maturation protein NosD [uncultured Muriicola sp.]|uniref:nitrous oxide reductase family maturation protein NosD n=1 Tax=uncultured Muriicola sp. TaxID=1583102 RepID=UPI00262A29BB|nr:nitrous oxide reductase family maturation protein NosD [uncultured Muriicola sp.]
MKIVFCFLLGLLCYAGQAQHTKVIEVCPTCPVSTIKEGIAMAATNDTLRIKKGTYLEYNIVIDKPLTLLGEDYPIIDGEDKGEIIRIVSDSVTIDGLFIKNVGTSYTTDWAAIRVVKSENYLIQNVVLEKLFFGIYLERSNNGRVYNNKIKGDAVDEYNSGNGIQLWYSKNVVVDRNSVQGVRDGIYLEFSDYITIKNNVSTKNLRYGLHFMFSNDDIYTNNTFDNNGAGVAVMFSKRIKMLNNTFRKNWGTAAFGMLLKEINDAEISGNTFEENTIGINIEGSNRIEYHNNNFIRNGWAVKVMGACYANTFKNNNFLYNSFDISYNSKMNDNVFDQNYWSEYTGYDLDKDGVGDIPYRPVKLFSYIVNRTPETIILLRSLFMDIIDFSEKVSPVFTPDNLLDANPLMKRQK